MNTPDSILITAPKSGGIVRVVALSDGERISDDRTGVILIDAFERDLSGPNGAVLVWYWHASGIERAVDLLRAIYGPMPVFNKLAHYHTDRPLIIDSEDQVRAAFRSWKWPPEIIQRFELIDPS